MKEKNYKTVQLNIRLPDFQRDRITEQYCHYQIKNKVSISFNNYVQHLLECALEQE